MKTKLMLLCLGLFLSACLEKSIVNPQEEVPNFTRSNAIETIVAELLEPSLTSRNFTDEDVKFRDYLCSSGICPCGTGDGGDTDFYLENEDSHSLKFHFSHPQRVPDSAFFIQKLPVEGLSEEKERLYAGMSIVVRGQEYSLDASLFTLEGIAYHRYTLDVSEFDLSAVANAQIRFYYHNDLNPSVKDYFEFDVIYDAAGEHDGLIILYP